MIDYMVPETNLVWQLLKESPKPVSLWVKGTQTIEEIKFLQFKIHNLDWNNNRVWTVNTRDSIEHY